MYCGYSTATIALRAKPSLCHSRRLAILDDGGGDDFPLRGLSINPRFLLYGYYLRQSSLIYWSPLRSFLAGHDGHSYSRMSLLDDEPYSARVPARRGGSRDCCCCYSSQRSFRRDPYRENYGDRIWEDDADYDEFDRSRRYPRREVEIRSSDGEKMRSLRARKDRSCSICPSCGHGSKTSGGRNIGRELGKKANATARKVREGQKMEDDIGYDSSEESNYDVRLSNRKGRGKTKLMSLSRQEKEEDRHFTEEDEFNIRDSRRKSGNYSRISVANEDFNMDSKSNNVVDLRKVDKDKHFTSIKRHAVVDQQLVEKDNQEFDKRVQKGASWSVSSHRRDEGYNGRPHTIRRESREGFQKVVSDIHEDDTMMTSRSKKFADERKVDMAVSSTCTVKQHHQVDKRVVGQTEMRTGVSNEYHNEDQVASKSQSREGSQKFLRISEVHMENADRISSMENMVNTRKVKNEQSSTSTSKHHTAIHHQLVESCETREHLQNLRRMEEAQSNNAQRTINEQRRREEVIVKNRDDKSMSFHIATDKGGQVNQQLTDKKEVDEQHENHVSGLYVRGSENASSSQSFQQSRIDDRVDYSTSTVNLVYQAEKLQNQSEGQVTHESYLQRESGRSSCISELPRKGTGRVSAPVINKSHKKDELDHRQYSSRIESVEVSSISEFSKTDIQRDSNLQKQSNTRIGSHEQNSSFLLVQAEPGILTGERSQPTDEEATFTGTLDGDSGSLHTHVQQLDNQTHRDDTYVDKGDVLDSASRLERSSAMYVGEFVDKLKKETSSFKRSSGTQTEETESRGHQDKPMQSGTRVVMTREKDDKYTQETPRRSSSRSGMKGPSDEMWDFRSPNSQEDNRTAEMRGDGMSAGVVDSTISTPTAETTISRRNPKSLWAHIADIIRMGWVHHAESHTSTRKSGKRSSSEGSEAWFSGQDASDNENDINGRSRTLKDILPIGAPIDQGQETHSSITQGSVLEAPGIAVMEIGGGASTSMGISGGNVLVGASVDTRLEDIELAKNESEPKNRISSTTSFDQSPPLTGDISSVSLNEIIAYTGNLPEPVSGYAKLEADLKIEEPSDVNKSPEKDTEIKRRKLQRNKQVLKETFEDWEEAYRLESEQRKIDEFFMREALVEAQKAADVWEVPVGAVLVHNGKIIARGFNLVEEKRDSTAHAEMICIREASDLLRTWRLADTTLYVTLEPCPMCAGAILQARIDTVVWGAPNKLLGADGSWVRLFPGDGGSNSLDASSQTGGPVHPFHPNIQIRRGVLATECSDAMQQFFQLRRKKKKKKQESPPPSCLPVPNHPIKLFTKMHNIFSITHCL